VNIYFFTIYHVNCNPFFDGDQINISSEEGSLVCEYSNTPS